MKLNCEQCMIRDFRPKDAEAVAKYANNRKIWLQLRDAFPHPYHIEDAREFISRVTVQTPCTVFAIAMEKEVIGAIGLEIGQDIHRHTAELGYWLAEPYWGKGLMTDVVRTFSNFAFREFDLQRVFAEPYATNPASARVLEKAGFRLEGRLQAHAVKNGKVVDMLLYARTVLDNDSTDSVS